MSYFIINQLQSQPYYGYFRVRVYSHDDFNEYAVTDSITALIQACFITILYYEKWKEMK